MRFHSRGNHLCNFIGTKESIYIQLPHNYYGTPTWPPSGDLENYYGCHDVTCETLYLEKQIDQKGPARTRLPRRLLI